MCQEDTNKEQNIRVLYIVNMQYYASSGFHYDLYMSGGLFHSFASEWSQYN